MPEDHNFFPFFPAVFSDQESPHRRVFHKKMLLHEPLKNRQAFRTEGGIHCELYEANDKNAPLIVFLAGIGTYCELYAELLFAISESGFNVVGVDLRGHGYSEGERGVITIPHLMDDLSLVLDGLETRFNGPYGVYGYSIGATIGASLAARDNRICALFGSTLLLPELAPDMFHQMGWQWMQASAFWMPGYKVSLQQFLDYDCLLKQTGAADYIKHDPFFVTSFPLKTLSSLFNTSTGLLHCDRDVKIGILHGDRDEVLPLSYSQKVVNRSRIPMDLVVAKGQGHMLPWDDCDLNARLVSDWFAQVF